MTSKTCTTCRFKDGSASGPCRPCIADTSTVFGRWEPQEPEVPDSNPKTRFGMAKPPIALVPPTALVQMSLAMGDGARKYGPFNWRASPVSTSTYVNAAMRHLISWWDGEEAAADSGVHHLAHAASCLAILMDAEANGCLQDDRPKAGVTSALIAEKTKPLT